MDRWVKYSLLAMISDTMKKQELNLGKTSMQKLVFLIKELFGVQAGYEFGLYIYGPYSEELTSDLEYLSSLNVLEMKYEDQYSYRGYKIAPGEKYSEVLEKSQEFVAANQENVERVVELFGGRTARELELKATIVYLTKAEHLERSQLVDRIRKIKPYFNEGEITGSIDELRGMGFLN